MKKAIRFFTPITTVVLVLSLAFVLWPLVRSGFYVSDDGEWMVIRLSAFYQSLAEGQFPVRYLGRLNNSYGYPVANFLYPGYLYIGSLLRLIGFSFVDAVKVILGVSVAGAGALMYASLRTRYTPRSSLIGTVSFIFAPYLLYDLYHRGSVGEVLAMFAATAAIYALTRGFLWAFAPAVALLIVSHNTLALIIGVALAVLGIVSRQRKQMIIAGIVGIGMAAFFWLPALIERVFVRFGATRVSDPSQYFITPELATLLGVPTVIALGILVFGVRRKHTVWDMCIRTFVAAGIVLSLPVSAIFWTSAVLPQLVQFPYRFLVLPVLFGPFMVSELFDRVRGWRMITLLALFVSVWGLVAATQLRSIRFVNRLPGYYSTNEGTTNVANEYMPKWVIDIPGKRPQETLEIVDGDADVSRRTFAGENINVSVVAREESTLQINKVYYPGWGVSIDNALARVEYKNALGVMRVTVPTGTHTITASFRETPFRLFADMISFGSVIGYGILLWKARRTS